MFYYPFMVTLELNLTVIIKFRDRQSQKFVVPSIVTFEEFILISYLMTACVNYSYLKLFIIIYLLQSFVQKVATRVTNLLSTSFTRWLKRDTHRETENHILQDSDFVPFRPTLKHLRANSSKHDFQTNSTVTYPKEDHYVSSSTEVPFGKKCRKLPSFAKQDIQNHVTEINGDDTEESENEYASYYSTKRKRTNPFVETHIHDEPNQLTDEENDDIEITPRKRTCILKTCKCIVISVFYTTFKQCITLQFITFSIKL